jgi:hypothetical protein
MYFKVMWSKNKGNNWQKVQFVILPRYKDRKRKAIFFTNKEKKWYFQKPKKCLLIQSNESDKIFSWVFLTAEDGFHITTLSKKNLHSRH